MSEVDPAVIDALCAQVKSLAAVVDELQVELLSGRRVRPAAPSTLEMMPARRVDRLCGKANGTARDAYLSGQVRGQLRDGRSRTGQVLWISVVDAQRVWGGQRVAGSA